MLRRVLNEYRLRAPRSARCAACSLATLFLAALGAGCGDAAPALPAPPPSTVAAQAADAVRELPPDGWVGVILPRRSVELAAETAGRLSSVEVRVGQRVDAGAVLARIDTEPARQELAVARASLQAQRAEASRHAVELADAKARLARRDSLPELFSQEELAAARLQKETARAALEAARARVSEQEAEIAKLERNLSNTEVRAPYAGIIALRRADPGALVIQGTPLLQLITEDVLLRFAVPPEEADELAVGDRVIAHIDALGRSIEAVVEDIAPAVDTASLLIFVEARPQGLGDLGTAPQAGLATRVYPAGATPVGGSSSSTEGTRSGAASRSS